MKFENTEVFNFEGALRGMRLPMQSNAKADSHYCIPNQCINCKYGEFVEPMENPYHWEPCCGEDVSWTPYCIGENDMDLAQRLVGAGSEHSKFLRQIFVSVDITASEYWWSQCDTYKIGTTASSTSKMHKLASTPITIDCFEIDDYEPDLIFEEGIDDHGDNPWDYKVPVKDVIGNCETQYFYSETIIGFLESLRQKYNETKDKRYWKELIRWLPESWLQTRTWTANYAVVRNIYMQRCKTPHKLGEWRAFGDWVLSLPYASYLLTYERNKDGQT